MAYEYPFRAREQADRDEVRVHVREALESACHAIKRSRRREEFPALLDLILAAKNAEEAVEQ